MLSANPMMRLSLHAIILIGALILVNGQAASFCKDDDCVDCSTSLAAAGSGHPGCVVYDTETVFGGLGFWKGEGNIKYLIHGNFQDPCGDQPGSFIIRSPARRTANGCGDIIFSTVEAQCSVGLEIRDTFMVQFCCGSSNCSAAGVPGARRKDSNNLIEADSGLHGAYLKFANGTIIPPLETDSSLDIVTRHDECKGFKDGSYVADGDTYRKTFDTMPMSPTVGPFANDTEVEVTYNQSISRTTTFDVSIGDPFGIISRSVGIEFEDSKRKAYTIPVPVLAGQQGVIGFTPVFLCTNGTLEDCDGVRTEPGESCTPFLTANGLVEGDYALMQS